jgi:hypothetical protein
LWWGPAGGGTRACQGTQGARKGQHRERHAESDQIGEELFVAQPEPEPESQSEPDIGIPLAVSPTS